MLSTNDISQDKVEEVFEEFFDIVELLNDKYDLPTILEGFLFRKSVLEAVIVAMWRVEDKNKLEEKAQDLELVILETINSEEFSDSIAAGESHSNKEVINRVELMLREINKVIV